VAGGHEANNLTDWAIQARFRLALRRAEKPATKACQIRALWPDIEIALGLGQSMKTICAWLAEDAGITLGVTSLASYVSRIRRREAHRRTTTPELSPARLTPVDASLPVIPACTPASKSHAVSTSVSGDLTRSPIFARARRRTPDFITVPRPPRTRTTWFEHSYEQFRCASF
jgi:hypothetical protein